MRMPTIHCLVEEGKSVCGKTKGLCMELKDFKKEMKSVFFLGGCGKCIEIVKSKYHPHTKKHSSNKIIT